MARTKRIRRSYSAGEWGRNRVRVFPDPETGLIQIEWRENGRRLSRALGHRNWGRAKRKANQFPACFTGLSQRDWDRFIRVRRSDKVGPRRRVHRPNVPLVNLPRLTWSSPVGRNPPGIRASMPPGWIASLRLSTM